jgi:ABC-2 type transport system permease protein
MKNLKLIIKREFLARVRNKSFLLMTILSPLIFVGMIFLVVFLSSLNNEEIRVVSVLDESNSLLESLEDTENLKFKSLTDVTLEEAKLLSNESNHHGLLYIPLSNNFQEYENSVQFFTEGSPNINVIQYIEKSLNTRLTNLKLMQEGVDLVKIDASKQMSISKLKISRDNKPQKCQAGSKRFLEVQPVIY